MPELSSVAVVVGVAGALLALPCAVWPAKAEVWLRGFPRSAVWARILTAIGLAWVTWLLFRTPLGWFEKFKPALWVLAPVAYLAVVALMAELLAPRALGGLLLLVAAPVLDVARWHPSGSRFVLTLTAYAWVIAGLVLALSPYRFRQVAAVCCRSSQRCRALAVAGVAFGLLILLLGLTVYRRG